VVAVETVDVFKQQKPYDEMRYVKALRAPPLDDDE
jgi:hypothetical protein